MSVDLDGGCCAFSIFLISFLKIRKNVIVASMPLYASEMALCISSFLPLSTHLCRCSSFLASCSAATRMNAAENPSSCGAGLSLALLLMLKFLLLAHSGVWCPGVGRWPVGVLELIGCGLPLRFPGALTSIALNCLLSSFVLYRLIFPHVSSSYEC